jgi:CheY-like chemotaxis protein
VEVLRSWLFDALHTDYQIPELDNYSITRALEQG